MTPTRHPISRSMVEIWFAKERLSKFMMETLGSIMMLKSKASVTMGIASMLKFMTLILVNTAFWKWKINAGSKIAKLRFIPSTFETIFSPKL